MNEKSKILFVSHSSAFKGAERSLLDLVLTLQQSGHFEVAVLVPGKGTLFGHLTKHHITTFTAHYYHWNGRTRLNRITKGTFRLLFNCISMMSCRGLIKQYQPDLIYINTITNPFGALLAYIHHIPCIWHIREFIHEDMGHDFDSGKCFTTWLLKQSSLLICNSDSVKEKWQSYLAMNQLVTVYNGFDLALSSESGEMKYSRCVEQPEIIQLAIIGTVSPHKGQSEAIKAVLELVNAGLKLRLLIIGDGRSDYLDGLKNFVFTNKLDDFVNFVGLVETPLKVIQQVAIVLMCSKCEAFGRVVVEAMSVGTPVIVSDQGGVLEIIQNNQFGLHYESGNHYDLANKINYLLDDKNTYISISNQSRKRVNARFQLGQHAKKIENHLNSFL